MTRTRTKVEFIQEYYKVTYYKGATTKITTVVVPGCNTYLNEIGNDSGSFEIVDETERCVLCIPFSSLIECIKVSAPEPSLTPLPKNT